MAMGAIGAFAEGLGSGIQAGRARKQREEDNARMDRYLDLMERQPQQASFPGGMGASPVYGGQPGQSVGGYGTPQQGAVSGGSGMFDLIDKHEGGGNYDTLFGHSQNGGRFDGVRVSDMTLSQLYDFTSPSGEYGQWVKGQVGRVATPMGRHQIVGSTLRAAATKMGLSPDTKFTPQVQDSIANYLARNRLAGATSPAAKRAAMRAEWEGFKHVSDSSLDAAIAQFEANGGMMRPRPMGAMQPQ